MRKISHDHSWYRPRRQVRQYHNFGPVPVKPNRATRIEGDGAVLNISAEHRSIKRIHSETHDFLRWGKCKPLSIFGLWYVQWDAASLSTSDANCHQMPTQPWESGTQPQTIHGTWMDPMRFYAKSFRGDVRFCAYRSSAHSAWLLSPFA